jgi:hypothetical protein
MSFYEESPSPIEVWLRQKNMEVNCVVVREDESTDHTLDVVSLSMRGAQREITGNLIDWGYKPEGRWVQEADGESWRRFKLTA